MMFADKQKTVTLLRPTGMSASDELERCVSRAEAQYSFRTPVDNDVGQILDATVYRMREMILEIGKRMNIRVILNDYDMPKNRQTPTRRASLRIEKSDVIASLNPSDSELSYIGECVRNNPVMCGLIAYTDEDYTGKPLFVEYLKSMNDPAILGEKIKTPPRIFAGRIHKDESRIRPQISAALRFPSSSTSPVFLPI